MYCLSVLDIKKDVLFIKLAVLCIAILYCKLIKLYYIEPLCNVY